MGVQYGEDIGTYERLKKALIQNSVKSQDYTRIIAKSIIFFTIAMLVSRVILINRSAPFGIAFLLTVLFLQDNRISIITGIGSVIGYLTLIGTLDNALMYITIIPTIVMINLILSSFLKKRIHKMVICSLIITMIFSYGMLINEYSFLLAIGAAVLEGICIFPIYLVLEYGIDSFKRINTKYLFSNEDIIAMSIVVSLIIAGTWRVSIINVGVLNLLSIVAILIMSYVCGATVGATTGIAMGVIVGMSSGNIFIYASILGICGLIAGMFKEAGKIFTALSTCIIFFIMKIYMSTYLKGQDFEFIIAEALIAFIIFLVIPERIYNSISRELDSSKKGRIYEDGYKEKIRETFTERLSKFYDVLENMSNILVNLADNDKLDMKSKSSGIIENLAHRVCEGCDTNRICWGREMINTYSAFGELIENIQNKNTGFPIILERKCIKKASLIRNTQDIVNRYIINEMWRTRLAEGRELIAGQFGNMAKSVDEIIEEFSTDFNEDKQCQENILRILEKNDMDIDDVFCIRDKNNRLIIEVKTPNCNGRNQCSKKMQSLINACTENKMVRRQDGCRINPNTNQCTAVFEEAPKFRINTSIARESKDGQSIFGDSFSYGRGADGTYMMLLSDGMGSGPQAGRESEAVVELIEKFVAAGFTITTAIKTVNSIMSLKSCEEEKFSTVDLGTIDVYTGDIDFAKVGAVASFIKSGDTIDIIKSKSLPIGVLDEVDIEIHQKKLRSGDLVVMVTDGVLDYSDDSYGKVDWVLDYLCRHDNLPTEELAKGIIKEAKKLGGNKVKDDMTVLVSKVYVA